MKLFLIIFGIIILIVFVFKANNIEIKWKSFLKKGFLVDNGPFGVYCYCGKQGRGKTYSVVEFLQEHKNCKIYANLRKLDNVPYIYIGSFEELLDIKNDSSENIIIFYDEIFTALTKQDKLTKQVLGFLSQMRKRKIIFLTTAQEWLEINVTLRRYVRFQIECDNKSILGRTYLIKTFYDGESMHWDHLQNEYVAPVLSVTISKMNKYIADSYDTYEVIESSNKFLQISNISKSISNSSSNSLSDNESFDSSFWDSESPETLIESENENQLETENTLESDKTIDLMKFLVR